MGNMKFYRLEHKVDRLGPYQYRKINGECVTAGGFCIQHKLPTFTSNKKFNHFQYVFGWQTEELMLRFIYPDYYNILNEKGYVISIYETDEYLLENDGQVGFVPKTRLNEIDINTFFNQREKSFLPECFNFFNKIYNDIIGDIE